MAKRTHGNYFPNSANVAATWLLRDKVSAPVLLPQRGPTYQPRATPWVAEIEDQPKPCKGAARWSHGLGFAVVSPLQGFGCQVLSPPRALPWADMFWPPRGKNHRKAHVGSSVVLVVIAALFLSTTPASGHDMDIFARVDGTTIHGEVHYGGDTPAKDLTVTVFAPAHQEIGQTKTDDRGQFQWEAKHRCDHLLMATTSDGHAVEYTVTAAELPDTLPTIDGEASHTHTPTNAPGDTDIATLRTEIGLLRRDIADYQRRVRLSDILGGIGYLVGLSGAAFYFLGVRRKESKTV